MQQISFCMTITTSLIHCIHFHTPWNMKTKHYTDIKWATLRENLFYGICKQQKKTQISLCVAQSDLRFCCSLPIDSMILHLISRNSKTLASFSNWANRFETYLVANPECAVRTAKNLVWGSGLSLRCSHTHSSIYVISTLSARAGSYMLSVSFHNLIWLNCWHVTLYKKGHRL